MRITCIGPVLGRYTQAEAQAAGKPSMAGHVKRGVERREEIPARDENGSVILGDDGRPVIEEVKTHVAPCGQNLTALYDQVPADGEDHYVKCPQCGNVSRVTKLPPPDDAGG